MRTKKDVLDAKVVRGMCVGSNYVVGKMQIRVRWEYGKGWKSSKRRQVIASESLDRKEIREEYEQKI